MTTVKQALKQAMREGVQRRAEISALDQAQIDQYKRKQQNQRLASQGVKQDIPGFTGLAVMKHGSRWYIVDKDTDSPIGGHHSSKGAAVRFAQDNYKGQYESVQEAENLRDQMTRIARSMGIPNDEIQKMLRRAPDEDSRTSDADVKKAIEQHIRAVASGLVRGLDERKLKLLPAFWRKTVQKLFPQGAPPDPYPGWH